jgi:ubiquitin-conjugating enzyme E2 variant
VWREIGVGSGTRSDVGAVAARVVRCGLVLAVAACGVLGAVHLAYWLSLLDVAAIVPALAGLLLGALVADLVTGGVHWACDTWGDEHTRWIGGGLIASFREHHRDPRAMLAHDWIEVNGQPAAGAAVGFGVLAWPDAREWIGDRAWLHAFVWSLFAVGALANQLHRWSHTVSPPRWVRRLQRAGWIISPRGHARHHRPPHTGNYCIATGWLNGPLDACGFWRALERAITRISGEIPRREPDAHGASAAIVRPAQNA